MKKLLVSLLALSLTAFAAIDTLEFKVKSGSLHKGGYLKAKLLSVNDEAGTMDVELEYEVIKKALVPVPSKYLKGTDVEVLPASFQDERGYLELETLGKMELEEATLVHLGRKNVAGFENGHVVNIIAKNGKSETELHFHPSIPELGWGKIVMTMHTGLPVVGDYTIEARLK